MPTQTTHGIKIEADPSYEEGQSSPENSYYFWTYTITLTNVGSKTVQLLSRHWVIIDETGHVAEVKGAGVVGKQPVLEPGQSFTYTSGCPLNTPSGKMRGTYEMTTQEGETFEVIIPTFDLLSKIVYH